jgi:hypothetical protein
MSKRHVDCSRTGVIKNTILRNHVFKHFPCEDLGIYDYGFCSLFYDSDGIGLLS